METIEFGFLIIVDLISRIFSLVVLLIRLRVLLFSLDYIKGEKHYFGFHLLVISFIFSMLLLIFRTNLIRAILGWDGLGLSSYLLVIFYSNPKSFYSGIITALTNRLGDILILLRIGRMTFGSWGFKHYLELTRSTMIYVFVLLFIATCTKRAQIPFCAWLPAAIAAPTPVSSLVHSSTLVTAGVYVLIRHEDVLIRLGLRKRIFYLGLGTMVIGRLRAFFESDIKKIVALSTLRQLGVMIRAIGVGAYQVAYLHLLAHAFFKALLFICTGLIIHSSINYQDIRTIGGSYLRKPEVMSFIVVASISLIGLPFSSGFYSKEIILETILFYNLNLVSYLYFFLGAVMTAFYRCRFLIEIFYSNPKKERMRLIHECSFRDLTRIRLLLIPSLLGGYCLINLFFPRLFLFIRLLWIKLALFVRIFRFLVFSKLYFSRRFLRSSNSLSVVIIINIWIIPFFRSSLPAHSMWGTSIEAKKFNDQGNLMRGLRNILMSFTKLTRFSLFFNSQKKIMVLIILWGFLLIIVIY